MGGMHISGNDSPATATGSQAVDDLLRRAREHPLGTGFLTDGALDSVAAVFQVHAFVVDAARDRLATVTPTVQVTDMRAVAASR